MRPRRTHAPDPRDLAVSICWDFGPRSFAFDDLKVAEFGGEVDCKNCLAILEKSTRLRPLYEARAQKREAPGS